MVIVIVITVVLVVLVYSRCSINSFYSCSHGGSGSGSGNDICRVFVVVV